MSVSTGTATRISVANWFSLVRLNCLRTNLRPFVNVRGVTPEVVQPPTYLLTHPGSPGVKGNSSREYSAWGLVKKASEVPVSDDLTGFEHCDVIRDLAHDGQIVTDEEDGQSETGLQILEQVEHLRLDRNIKG